MVSRMHPVPAWIRELPKAELHVHLDGSLRPETMLELAVDAGAALPASDARGIAAALLVRDARNLEEYLDRYRITLALLQSRDALRRVARELVHDVAADSTRYVEARFCPALHTPAMTEAEAVDAVLEGLREGEVATGCVARLIVCGLRTLQADVSERMARVALDAASRGVVAFDLAGAEAGHPAKEHARAFEIAREGGLHRTCHAGEGYGPASVTQALDDCHAERIGHGTRIAEDPALVERVRRERIPLEVCVTSNVHTRVVADPAVHPVRRYHDEGLVVTINTDGRLMDGITLVDEYATAHASLGFDADALRSVARNAARNTFLAGAEREAFLDRFENELDEHAARYPADREHDATLATDDAAQAHPETERP